MARRTPSEAKPLDLDDATPYVAKLVKAEYQAKNEAHPDWPDQIRFVWSVEDQELWTWASIKLGQTRGGKVAKLRTILNALAGRKSNDPIAWLEDGSDGEPIAWGYPDGAEFADSPEHERLTLRLVGHNEATGDGGSKFVVDQYAAARTSRAANATVAPEPANSILRESSAAAVAPF